MNDRPVTITLPYHELEAFLELCKQASDRMGNAGCNDLPLPDAPEIRELWEQIEADRAEMTLDEWRGSEDYRKPPVTQGKVYFMDFVLFDYVLEKMARALREA